jgi:hypothetical protein
MIFVGVGEVKAILQLRAYLKFCPYFLHVSPVWVKLDTENVLKNLFDDL